METVKIQCFVHFYRRPRIIWPLEGHGVLRIWFLYPQKYNLILYVWNFFQDSVICTQCIKQKFLYQVIKDNKSVLQTNNYEIVINFFQISYSLTWYSAIKHKFTRIPVCSTYELTKQPFLQLYGNFFGLFLNKEILQQFSGIFLNIFKYPEIFFVFKISKISEICQKKFLFHRPHWRINVFVHPCSEWFALPNTLLKSKNYCSIFVRNVTTGPWTFAKTPTNFSK